MSLDNLKKIWSNMKKSATNIKNNANQLPSVKVRISKFSSDFKGDNATGTGARHLVVYGTPTFQVVNIY